MLSEKTDMHEPEFKKAMDRALALKRAGRLDEALATIAPLVDRWPKNPHIRVYFAGVLKKMERFEEAIKHFKIATEQKPDFEMASLGLFHCLLHVDRLHEAFDEMERYESVATSSDYEEMMAAFEQKCYPPYLEWKQARK